MSEIPANPGSYETFSAERTHHAVKIGAITMKRMYDDALTRFRESIASGLGITTDELHDGSYKREATEADVIQAADA